MSHVPQLVLASASPRRRELLAQLGVGFEVRVPHTDEAPLPGEPARDLVLRLALAKARAAARPGEIALGADTEVALDGAVLGKPTDAAHATSMLRALSGRVHEVWSGVALVAPERELAGTCRTEVEFRALTDQEIAAYVATGDPFDKAGAYAIQGEAAGFVARLDGELTNVVGLPLPLVEQLLAEFGFEQKAKTSI